LFFDILWGKAKSGKFCRFGAVRPGQIKVEQTILSAQALEKGQTGLSALPWEGE
jgi:hypothetical protein